MFKKVFKRKIISKIFVDSINNLFRAFNEFNDIGGTNPLNKKGLPFLLDQMSFQVLYKIIEYKKSCLLPEQKTDFDVWKCFVEGTE